MARADREPEQDYHAAGLLHSRQVYLHLLVNLILIVVLGIGFAASIAVLRKSMAQLDLLLAIKPENRVQQLEQSIAKTRSKVEQEYAAYEQRIEDPAISEIHRQFAALHQLTMEAEADYGQVLGVYQQVSYQLASGIRGSGEWYFYYDKSLTAAIQRHARQQAELKGYLAEKKP